MDLVDMTRRIQSQISLQYCVFLLCLVILSYTVPASALPQLPVANFTADPQQGSAHDPVRFTDTSTGDLVSWHWNFGDGTSSTLKESVHTYTYLGVYEVTLTVVDVSGNNTSVTKEVFMADSATPVPTTIEPVSPTPRPTGTPKSPVGIATVLAATSIVFLYRREKR